MKTSKPDSSADAETANRLALANSVARMRGADTLEKIALGVTTTRNPHPFEVTEENAENINPRPCRGGINPQHDAAQRTFERRDVGTVPSYRETVHVLASRVAAAHVRRSRMRVDHLRAEFVCEAESAIGEFLASRIGRFPTLCADLLARFALGALPSTTVRAMHRAAHRACDARTARMAGSVKLVEPSFFNLFADGSDESGTSRELTEAWVNSRIDSLLSIVRERGSVSGNARRSADAHAKLLEDARAYFLASIRGESVALPSAGLVASKRDVGFNVATVRRTKLPAQSRAEGERMAEPARDATGATVETSSYVVTESGAPRLASRALYMRLYRLAEYVGDVGIQTALARGQTCPEHGRRRTETRVQANA